MEEDALIILVQSGQLQRNTGKIKKFHLLNRSFPLYTWMHIRLHNYIGKLQCLKAQHRCPFTWCNISFEFSLSQILCTVMSRSHVAPYGDFCSRTRIWKPFKFIANLILWYMSWLLDLFFIPNLLNIHFWKRNNHQITSFYKYWTKVSDKQNIVHLEISRQHFLDIL